MVLKTKIRDIVSIGIFFILVSAAAFLVRPVYEEISRGVLLYARELKENVENQFSIRISYKSLSPSVLSSVNVRGVYITTTDDEQIASVNKIRLDYKLLRLLKGDFAGGFSSLVIDGVDVSGSNLTELIKRNQKTGAGNQDKKSNPDNFKFDPSMVFSDFPFNIHFKNLHATYEQGDIKGEGSVRKMDFVYNNKTRQFNLNANAFAKLGYKNQEYSGNLDFEGKLFEGFESSNASLTLNGLTDGNLKLNKMNFLFSYSNNQISCSSIKSTFPLGLFASYSFDTGSINAKIKTSDLSFSEVFQISRRTELYKKYGKLKFTTDSKATFNPATKELFYSTETSAMLPSNLVPSGALASVTLSGNDKSVQIQNVSLLGPDFDLAGDLNFDFTDMNLSGYVDVKKVQVPGGPVISSEIYIDPLNKGFLAFIPQLFIDENALTALQLMAVPNKDSFDFNIEGYDYSHFEADTPGKIAADGSFLFDEKFLQTSLSANSFFLDSALKFGLSFMPPETRNQMEKMVSKTSDFMFSADAYLSTDLSSVSYNVPYILLANTQKESQALLVSLDGTDKSVSLSQADLIFGKQAYHASGSVDFLKDVGEMFMILDLNAGDIPYHFAGTLANKVFDLNGDYNTSLRLDFSKKELFEGQVAFDNLPVSINENSILTSLNSDISYSEADGISVNLNRIEIEDTGNQLGIKPHLIMSGNVSNIGARLDSIVYSDLYSQLEGSADAFVTMSENILEGAGLKVSLKNPLTEESVSLNADVANPGKLAFDLNSFLKEFYIDSSVNLNHFNMNRFTRVKSNNNEMTASLYISGTPEHPYISAGLDNLSLLASGEVMRMSGSAILEDRDIIVNEYKFKMGSFEINNVSGNISLENYTGFVNAVLDAKMMEDNLHSSMVLEISDVKKEPGFSIPTAFTMNLHTDELGGSFIKKPSEFSLSCFYSEDGINIISSDNLGLFASFSPNGALYAVMASEGYASMKFDGFYNKKAGTVDGNISQINVDLKNVMNLINMDNILNVNSGKISGNLVLSGTMDSPLVNGRLALEKPDFTIPMVIKDKITCDRINILFDNGEISIPETRLLVKKSSELFVLCKLAFDKWRFDEMDFQVRTNQGKYVPLQMDVIPGVNITGDVSLLLKMLLTQNELELTGDILVEKTELFVGLTKLVSSVPSGDSSVPFDVRCNLNLSMGTHVRVNVDPLLRAIFVPGGSLKIAFGLEDEQLSIDGTLALKSGDISYLNRNFYIKEGSLKFSPGDREINPVMNVRAETRERDEDGDTVTIILSAQNQFLKDFNPRFSSVPAKSELEIQSLLGQIAVADSQNVGNFLFAAGDYALQSIVGRKFENKLRDFFNFDIFSLRTNFIQNTLNFSLTNKNQSKVLNAGNFFDNSTVYIGKYLGSALYIDAMVSMQYDEKRAPDTMGSVKFSNAGILFKPEFGMELESPFGNIRWIVAPDIDAMLHKQYIPSTSLSLSWKFSL